MLYKFFGNLKPIKFILFSMDKEWLDQEDDEWVGFVQTLKKFITKKNDGLEQKIDGLEQKIDVLEER